MPARTDIDTYGAAFARLEEGRTDRQESWIHGLRRDAFARFAELGFPTTRQEEFRHTSVEPIRATLYEPASQSAPSPAQSALLDRCPVPGPRLVFVNGHFVPGLSHLDGLEDGVRVASIAETLRSEPDLLGAHLGRYVGLEGSAFAALNTAFLDDGAFIHIGRWREAREPITIMHLRTGEGQPTAAYPRALVVAEEGSVASIVEVFDGEGDGVYMTNAVTEIAVGMGASVDHVRLQREGLAAHHVSNLAVRQDARSRFTSHAISLGASLARNDINLRFDGPESEGTLNGLFTADGHRHMDTHTVIDHAHPNCTSHQVYRGILDDKAHGVFAGRIIVRPDAQKTDARQNSRSLLLSRESTVNALPQLEIFADDVKCTHGATVGALDEDAVFYLRARGIPEAAARGLLIHAFAGVVLETVPVEPLREELVEAMLARFTGTEAPA